MWLPIFQTSWKLSKCMYVISFYFICYVLAFARSECASIVHKMTKKYCADSKAMAFSLAESQKSWKMLHGTLFRTCPWVCKIKTHPNCSCYQRKLLCRSESNGCLFAKITNTSKTIDLHVVPNMSQHLQGQKQGHPNFLWTTKMWHWKLTTKKIPSTLLKVLYQQNRWTIFCFDYIPVFAMSLCTPKGVKTENKNNCWMYHANLVPFTWTHNNAIVRKNFQIWPHSV